MWSLLVAVSRCQLTLVSLPALLCLHIWLVTKDLASLLKCCPESSSCGPHMATRSIYKKQGFHYILGLVLKFLMEKFGVKIRASV